MDAPPRREWAAAKKQAFDAPYDIAMMRVRRAEGLGLTYEEYTLEILERGRYLSAADSSTRPEGTKVASGDFRAEKAIRATPEWRAAEILRRRPVRY